uniref:C2H2-type domain-containing protein n=1 Tax=Caenorhabditis japonica TaxID=281687 RepID=A0A8R1IE56_CAEJA
MMKEGGGGANSGGFVTDFDYMHHMMQPLHLAIGRHSSQGSERQMSTESSAPAPARVPSKRSRSTHDGLMKCQFCPKKVSSEAALERHMCECRLIRPHECDQCGKRFKARGGLQQHMRIHNNDKAYTCQFCAKRFTQKSHLDQHERIHTDFIC